MAPAWNGTCREKLQFATCLFQGKLKMRRNWRNSRMVTCFPGIMILYIVEWICFVFTLANDRVQDAISKSKASSSRGSGEASLSLDQQLGQFINQVISMYWIHGAMVWNRLGHLAEGVFLRYSQIVSCSIGAGDSNMGVRDTVHLIDFNLNR